MKRTAACLFLALVGTVGCATDDGDDGDVEVPVGETKADGSAQIQVRPGVKRTLTFTTTSKPVDVSVNCGISANPDVVGTVFTVKSAPLGLSSASDPVAGYWQWSGKLTAGQKKIEITGVSGTATCEVSVTSFTASCSSSTSFHAVETNHTHLEVGTQVPTWGDFPASGNHWGAWSKWDTTYTKPVKRGFYLHNLEHGGVVLSYGCSSPTESAECAEAAANLQALKDASGETRVIITPDPEQPALYGVRAWRFGMLADCYDEGRLLDFLGGTIRHGREDIDANPPIPYDPTTLDVDCHNLFAAPDSCN